MWGGPGRACDRAGWAHNMLQAFAEGEHLESGSVFGDLQNFYEHIDHGVFLTERQATGFNLRLGRALAALYAGPRAIAFDGVFGEVLCALGTAIAGCSHATTVARVVLYRPLCRLQGAGHGLHVTNVVNDIVIQTLGTPAFVCKGLSQAGFTLAQSVSEQKLVLENTQNALCGFLSTARHSSC